MCHCVVAESATPGHRLVLSVPWGNDDAQFSKPSDVWDPSFQYFYVEGGQVFALDAKKQAILYFVGGRYVKSFDIPALKPVGLLYWNELIYYFSEGGVAAISVTTGEHRYTGRLPEWMNQDSNLFLYDGTIVAINGENMLCISADLKSRACPKLTRPAEYRTVSQLTLFANGDYAYVKYIPHKQAVLRTKVGAIKGTVSKFRESELLYDMPGSVRLMQEGIFYVEHTKDAAQIWFSPWKRKSSE
jgi:hypothetical protein